MILRNGKFSGKILRKISGKFSVRENIVWKIFYLTSLGVTEANRICLIKVME
jgi:hypothetical protein